MIVICEECGKKYSIDPSKIKGERARFKCSICSHLVTVTKPKTAIEEPKTGSEEPKTPSPPSEEPKTPSPPSEEPVMPKKSMKPDRKPKKEKAKKKAPKGVGLKSGRLGLRSKMAILFLLIPIVLIASAGALYLWQLDAISSFLTDESTTVVKHMSEEVIADTARAVAAQTKLFIQTHPDLKKEDFNQNPDFKKMALQKVGKTGYACIYAIPDENGTSRMWAHPNEKLIGIDVPKAMRKPLGKKYNQWWSIYRGAYKGKASKGYYAWQDKDGAIRNKFMVCVPVEGTPYVVAATTYLDEFTRPMEALETRAKEQIRTAKGITFSILGVTLLLIAGIVTLYGHRLTSRIKSLTDTADRISVGELDAEIEIKSKDELGDLGEAISRMQESIRLSIQRLRRRK
jgi:nitrogen fixation/metabolism regulation signal transduction histidine kinase